MPAALVFGASGQIGRALLPRLQQQGWEVVAVSREARHEPGTCWIVGALEDLSAVPGRFDVVFSCGPLDHFAGGDLADEEIRQDADRVHSASAASSPPVMRTRSG